MPLPLWAAMANGGKLYQLDDSSVGADQYVDANTNVAFVATLVCSPFTLGAGTYSSLRKVVLDVDTGATLSLIVQGIRDGDASGVSITRSVTTTDVQDQVVPLKVMGSEFQVEVTLSGWAVTTTPAASLGSAAITLVPRRGSRGGSET